jgi:1-acyl-sn-glycerol-3-phosphate acyltransferase
MVKGHPGFAADAPQGLPFRLRLRQVIGMQPARSVLFAVAFYVHLGIILVAMLPTLVLPRGATFAMARLWARNSLWLLDRICGLRTEFRGTENIPQGGFIVAVKHQAALETFAILPHLTDWAFVLKRELTFLPLFGWYLLRTGQIAIDRSKATSALAYVVQRSREVLAQGRALVIFPEGTRRPVGAPADYKAGIGRIYAEAGVPCLPVAVDTGLFWPRHGLLRRPGTVVIEFLAPIPPGLERRAFLDALKTRIETATDTLVAEALARDPALGAALAAQAGQASPG